VVRDVVGIVHTHATRRAATVWRVRHVYFQEIESLAQIAADISEVRASKTTRNDVERRSPSESRGKFAYFATDPSREKLDTSAANFTGDLQSKHGGRSFLLHAAAGEISAFRRQRSVGAL
jgi:hypothetical protein